MPFLLAHLAAETRMGAMFEVRTILRLAGRVPFRSAFATALVFACSVLPMLYEALLKNQIPPHALRWDLMLVFLVTVTPARILVGWVYQRATARTCDSPSWSWRIWQGVNGLMLCVGVGYYVYFLYLAQTGGELGQRTIWQFPSLLLPFPW